MSDIDYRYVVPIGETQFTYTEPEGTVYVEIHEATAVSWHEDGVGTVKGLRPVLRITSFPRPDGRDRYAQTPGWLTFRNRGYAVDQLFCLDPHHGLIGSSDRYSKGLLNEKLVPVGVDTQIRKTLKSFVIRVRDRFVADHPDWAKTSANMEYASMIDAAEQEIVQHRQKIQEKRIEIEHVAQKAKAVWIKVTWVTMGDRFTDQERQRYLDRLCTHRTAYGMPGVEYCQNKLDAVQVWRGQVECDEHEREAVINQEPVLRLAFILDASHTAPGERVARWDGSQIGTVREIKYGAVTVEWDVNPTPKIPGAKRMRFLSSALETGDLVRLP